jgi:DUF1680 family protein
MMPVDDRCLGKGKMKAQAKSKSPAQLARAALRMLHPSLALTLVRDRFGIERKAGKSRQHLNATMKWLCRAQDVAGGQGVSVGYSIMRGWWPPYPETTGYIIPTFYDYAQLTGKEEFRDRARRMADWEIEVQLPSGAIQAGAYQGSDAKRIPAAFNTGQVILGWCRAYLETADERYLAAAMRAGDWLISVQSEDGTWRLQGLDTETTVHTYDVRNAWSLLELNGLANEPRYFDAAQMSCAWTLRQQHDNGWFQNNAFFVSADKWTAQPFTHTIAYVMEGLQESWRLTGEDRYLHAVLKTAEQLLEIFESTNFMAGEFDRDWKSTATYSCLTGNAQIAGVWLRLSQTTRDERYLNAAVKLNDYVKTTQTIHALHPGTRGGIKGSHPLFGSYTPYTYVNWGAKFLADSLMLEERVLADFEEDLRESRRGGVGERSDDSEIPARAINRRIAAR